MKTAVVTGAAGFIGFHVSRRLLAEGYRVVGVDALTDYYNVTLKIDRLKILKQSPQFENLHEKIEKPGFLKSVLAETSPDVVIHLAAQPGVRYSIDNPRAYVDSNILGTFELLEAMRARPPKHALLASTSSVYGASTDMPYKELLKADFQLSFYAATKKATENMAHSYSHLYGIPVTLFRFFTVYGPWGRPDMAIFKFTKNIIEGVPIDVYNQGDMKRDFTFVDDLVESISRLVPLAPNSVDAELDLKTTSPVAPFRVINIGNSNPVQLREFINAIEKAVGKTAICNYLPMQPADVPDTWADCSALEALSGSRPRTSVFHGVKLFVDWYREYFGA